ncbi:MAG: hypothetical protein IT343_11785 [Candidatus Melainabacteria bacterium]|jgi:CheY-like chemotaxis protein|nr:hypothetical protein [Candidatus Melainabacteria bacterium]
MAGSHQTNEVFAQAASIDSMFSDAVGSSGDGAQFSATDATSSGNGTADSSHSLWKAAYDNPGETALIVGGTALAVGAVIASRGRLAKLMPRAKNEVLLVEDSPFFATAFKETLEAQGNKVTAIAGAKDLSSLRAGIGLGLDGKPVQVPLGRFNAAFVDGDLAGNVTGAQVVERLTAKHVSSVGISSQKAMNEEMLQQGAVAAGLKPSVFGALVNKDISVASVLKKPGTIQGQVDDYQRRYLADRTVGERAEQIIKDVMKRIGI